MLWARRFLRPSVLQVKEPKTWLLDAIKNHLSELPKEKQKIFVTGHSKGGGMASIGALLIRNDKSLPHPAAVVTFTAPNAGSEVFAEAYDKDIHHVSYENDEDLVVPHALFPSLFDKDKDGDIDDDLGDSLRENLISNFFDKTMTFHSTIEKYVQSEAVRQIRR